ncbi:hypothetical protein D9M72_552610 [compost metagenome]
MPIGVGADHHPTQGPRKKTDTEAGDRQEQLRVGTEGRKEDAPDHARHESVDREVKELERVAHRDGGDRFSLRQRWRTLDDIFHDSSPLVYAADRFFGRPMLGGVSGGGKTRIAAC